MGAEAINKSAECGIKGRIILETSVVPFSSYWKEYYDLACAGEETIGAFLDDIHSHRRQVG